MRKVYGDQYARAVPHGSTSSLVYMYVCVCLERERDNENHIVKLRLLAVFRLTLNRKLLDISQNVKTVNHYIFSTVWVSPVPRCVGSTGGKFLSCVERRSKFCLASWREQMRMSSGLKNGSSLWRDSIHGSSCVKTLILIPQKATVMSLQLIS